MAKSYYTREELLAKDRKKVQEVPEKYIITHKGFKIKREFYTREDILERGISFSQEEREKQDRALEKSKLKPIERECER